MGPLFSGKHLPPSFPSPHLILPQLAEAILTEQAPGEDPGAIVLNDTRTRRRSSSPTLGGSEHERQFLVGSDEEDDEESPEPQTAASHFATPALEEDVRSFSSNASMDSSDSEDHPKPHRRTPSLSRDGGGGEDGEAPGPFMLHAAARTSHADVHSLMTAETATLAEADEDHGVEAQAPSGLAAKAGIIIGIHNIFIVIPQFIMTGIASVTFALLDPTRGATAPSPTSPSNSTLSVGTGNDTAPALSLRAEGLATGGVGANSYVIIYRYVFIFYAS